MRNICRYLLAMPINTSRNRMAYHKIHNSILFLLQNLCLKDEYEMIYEILHLKVGLPYNQAIRIVLQL